MVPVYRLVLQQLIKLLLQVSVLVVAATLVRAVYYLDDMNPSITYSDEFFHLGSEPSGYDFDRTFNRTL